MDAQIRNLPTVLIVDDEIRSQESLRRTLEDDFEVFTASGAEEAQVIMEREWVNVILCDQRMPGTSGVEFLKQVREQWPDAVRMIISGYTEAEDIIAGVNEAGIYQYLFKPWRPDDLLQKVREAAELFALQQECQPVALEMRSTRQTLKREIERKRAQVKSSHDFGRLVRSPNSVLNGVCDTAARIAPYNMSILITGESGTGKELLARAIHYNGARADKAFVVQNCGALPDDLLESELFGCKKGAFTGAYEDRMGLFEVADGGTIFLDEIGETSPTFQVKLLRVLQEGEIRPLGSARTRRVDVRVIAATNRDLEQDVRERRFREDLYYRVAGFSLHMPPLRERRDDIPLIAGQILADTSASMQKPVAGFTDETLECLAAYHWPGNVRELQNEVLRMLALGRENTKLGAELLSPRVMRAALPEDEAELNFLAGLEGGLKERMEALEARIIRETMLRHRWNRSRAAQELGLSRVGLRSKLSRYGLGKGTGEQ